MIVYADIYIIINAFCDWIALWSCGKILSLKISYGRLILGTLFLTAYAFCGLFMAQGGIFTVFINAISLCVGCMIAYGGGSASRVFKTSAVFVVSCVMIGGAVGWLAEAGKTRMIVAVCLTPVIYFIWMCVARESLKNKRIKTVKIKINGKPLCGLVDSGNLLTEPSNGFCVIVAKQSLFPEIQAENFITVSTACGEGALPYFFPEDIEVGGQKVCAAVAVDKNNALKYDCIVPLCLI